MYLDKTLARRAEIELTVISRENFILFTPMLHEVAAEIFNQRILSTPIRLILRHARFVEAECRQLICRHVVSSVRAGLPGS